MGVASYVAPATYTHATYGMPVYSTYAGVHHLGKREAEADSQYLYSNGVYNTGVYNGVYNTYAGVHHLGKREAEADSQFVYNTYAGYPYATGYTGYTGYTGLTGYTTPYTYGNIYNRYHF